MANAGREMIEPGVVRGNWWHRTADGRVQCHLCPRLCRLWDGQRGFCFVRSARNSEMVLTSYGRAHAYAIDPIEKKPLFHFYPGSRVLSLGTVGCNLGCRYCQNWELSRARRDDRSTQEAAPNEVVEVAQHIGCIGVAFTYNDPTVFAEYAIDCAAEARARGLRTVAVSNGYIMPEARREFYAHMDAANIDLKALSEPFYRKICLAHLAPVLDTLAWLKHETTVWLEVTTLLVPGQNDSDAQIEALAGWCAEHLGPDVPLHLSAFHPAFRMLETPSTPASTLWRARELARAAGLKYVYTGNIRDAPGQSTHCSNCGQRVIGRDGFGIMDWRLDEHGCCTGCGERLPGCVAVPDPRRVGAVG